MAITTADLIADIRQLSGLKRNLFYTDADIAVMVSDAAKELYDCVVAAYEHYFKRTMDFTLTGFPGNTTLLPTDFYKEVLLELQPTNPYPVTVKNASNFAYKNRGAGQLLVNGLAPREFLINGDELEIIPAQNSAGDYRLYYVPQLEDMVLPNTVSLAYSAPSAPVNATARLTTTEPIVEAGSSWTIGTNTALLTIPGADASPLEFDGVQPAVGDIVLVQKGAGFNGDPLNMGLWVFSGVSASGGELNYSFDRLAGYQHGAAILYGNRVKITDGKVYARSILFSTKDLWTIDTNSSGFSQASDSTLTVDLLSTGPVELPGAIWSIMGNDAQLLVVTPGEYGLTIDGVTPSPGQLTWWTPDDAPSDPTFAGAWVFTGITGTGEHLGYNFTRPLGMAFGDTFQFGMTVAVRSGETQRGTYHTMSTYTLIGDALDGSHAFLLPVDSMDTAGHISLTNAMFDTTYVGGSLTISGSPLGDRSYTISSIIDETHAILTSSGDPLIAETFGVPTTIEVTLAGTRTTLPIALQPWHLFIKVHAAIAIRTGRNQDASALQGKLEQERLRVNTMAANRQEDVTQAPITRGMRGGWLGWGR